MNTRIRSLDANIEGNKILVGTLGSELFELNLKSKSNFQDVDSENLEFSSRCFMRGHYSPSIDKRNKVNGLASLNDGDHFLTCSDDCTLRIWSISKKEMVSLLVLNVKEVDTEIQTKRKNDQILVGMDTDNLTITDNSRLRAMAVSPNGYQVAVGCKDGTIFTVNIDNYTFSDKKSTSQNKNQSVSVMKYSPNGAYLAVGSHEAIIDVYKAPDCVIKYSMKGHSSSISGLDFTTDSKYLQSTCLGQELLYWSIEKREQLHDGARELKDKEWKTWNCPLGWSVQGIWKDYYADNDINKVERSESRVNGEQKYLATGDKYGQVRLYKYPCLATKAQYVVGLGHNSEVINLIWVDGDRYVVTTGGEDQTVMVWKVESE